MLQRTSLSHVASLLVILADGGGSVPQEKQDEWDASISAIRSEEEADTATIADLVSKVSELGSKATDHEARIAAIETDLQDLDTSATKADEPTVDQPAAAGDATQTAAG